MVGIKLNEVDKFKKHQLNIAKEEIMQQSKQIVCDNIRALLKDSKDINSIEDELDGIEDVELRLEGYKLLTSIMGKEIFSLKQNKR